MDAIVSRIRLELKRHADKKNRESGQRYFKETVRLYGVKTAMVSRIGKEQFKLLPDKSKASVWPVCEALWQSGYMEESFIACQWTYALRKVFEPADFEVFEKWIERYVDNWAACDTFCNHSLGAFIDTHPAYLTRLKKWAVSKNRWLRRASAVTLIIPARAGRFLEVILELADILLLDSDDMVQKGYGWMLKVASQRHQQEVFDYIMKNKARMPRTALRYAIEKMPAVWKHQAMAK